MVMGEIKLSVRAYAKRIGVDESAVRKAIGNKDGGRGKKIIKGYDPKTKKIIPSIADKEWGFLHKNPKPQRGLSKAKVADKLNKKKLSKQADNDDKPEENPEINDTDFNYEDLIKEIKIHPHLAYSEALRRKEIINIANDRMKLEEANGMLVRKDDVNKALYAIGDQLKKELLNLPNRITEDIRTANNKVEAMNIFTIELNQVLTQIASIGLQ